MTHEEMKLDTAIHKAKKLINPLINSVSECLEVILEADCKFETLLNAYEDTLPHIESSKKQEEIKRIIKTINDFKQEMKDKRIEISNIILKSNVEFS